jgi:LPS-assembly lipoprotein
MMRAARTLGAGPALLLLAGCGFHLQRPAQLPQQFDAAWLEAADPYTDFHRALDGALRTAGARFAATRGTATVLVEVLVDDSGQRVLSVSALNKPTEFEVYYTVRYRARFGTREVLPPQVLTLTRDYSYDPTTLLAKEQEQQLIREALARDIAELVVRRLAALPP